jgi:PAS domain-containing protein
MSLEVLDFLAISMTAIVISVLVWSAVRRASGTHRSFLKSQGARVPRATLLLEGAELIDCSPEAKQLLDEDAPNRVSVVRALSSLFPSLGKTLENGLTSLTIIPSPERSDIWLEVAPLGQKLRLAICGKHENPLQQIGLVQAKNENTELEFLRQASTNSPYLMWRQDVSGQLVWANEAYLTACDACSEGGFAIPKLPINPLFEDLDAFAAPGRTTVRRSITYQDDEADHWFDISASKSDNGTIFYAVNANPIVRAELGQRKFVQTLSQTFAQLSIGLAIFDRRRQLATFNPALLDMTNLPFEFLSGRPSIDAMLDRLREFQMLPEPKDYASWREKFTMMEQAAKEGTYCENWNLPDGQTFRVTGRPHPDGAFALLFEDISAEISLTRRFRTEIETCQSVLDTLDEGIVVFLNGGNLVLANEAYCTFWDTDLEDGIGHHDLRAEILKWQERCTPTRIWTNLKELTNQMGMRKHWTETALMDDGRQLTCSASPISGGMTMIKFRFGGAGTAKLRDVNDAKEVLIASGG